MSLKMELSDLINDLTSAIFDDICFSSASTEKKLRNIRHKIADLLDKIKE